MTATTLLVSDGSSTLYELNQNNGSLTTVATPGSTPFFSYTPDESDLINVTIGGTLYFVGASSDDASTELYSYQGTQVAALTAASDSTSVDDTTESNLGVFGSDLLFSESTNGGTSFSLLAYNTTNQSTTTVLSGADASDFVTNNGTLYFMSNTDGGLYSWTGSGSATEISSSAHIGSDDMVVLGGNIYWGSGGGEIREYNTTTQAITTKATEDPSNPGLSANNLIVFNNKLYFDAVSTGVFSLSTAGTVGTIVAAAGASSFTPVVYTTQNELVFSAFNASFEYDFYTINSSGVLGDIQANLSASGFVQAGGTLYFSNGSAIESFNGSSIATVTSGASATVAVVPFQVISWSAACYAAGTRILTARGEVEVESLRPGDLAVTAGAAPRLAPVRWIGHRRLSPARHPRPWDVNPVRIRAGALGPGQPGRDLLLSPDHALFIDGVLMRARDLLNGATVAQEEVAEITYYHVELDRHDVLLAEGLPAESFLDTGNRAAFENGGASVMAHPDFSRAVWERHAVAPLVWEGRLLADARGRLAARAGQIGWTMTDQPGLHLTAGGRSIRPLADGAALVFDLPPDTETVCLRSRSTVPAFVLPEMIDTRVLGVAVTSLARDGVALALDSAALGDGWHAPERGLRWTDGAATLRVDGARRLECRTARLLRYWVAPACVGAPPDRLAA
jgi:Hint domain